MKIACVQLCLFCLFVFAKPTFASEDITDLGEIGFSRQLNLKNKGITSHLTYKNNFYIKDIDFAYKAKLIKHEGPVKIRRFGFKKNPGIPQGTRIFVFSCYDEDSVKIASAVNFDYGLCIEYKSLGDIEDFKEKAGINKPVQIANDDILESFKINSYPALITLKEDEFQIQEGF